MKALIITIDAMSQRCMGKPYKELSRDERRFFDDFYQGAMKELKRQLKREGKTVESLPPLSIMEVQHESN